MSSSNQKLKQLLVIEVYLVNGYGLSNILRVSVLTKQRFS